MKNILLTMITIAGIGLASKAQTFGFQQSDIFLEGAVNFSTNDNKNSEISRNSLSLTPKVGYMISDKFALGAQITYANDKTTNYSGSTDTYTKTNTIGAALFGRYYFLEAGSRFNLYGEVGLGFSTSGGETGNGSTTVKQDKTNAVGFNGGIGANYFITENIAIGYQFSDVLGYNSTKINSSGAKPVNKAYLNLNSFNNFFNTGQFSLTFRL